MKCFATDERFIGLDFAAHFVESAPLHGQPDTVHHEPCALLSDAECPSDFVGTDPVLIIDHHPNGQEPFFKPDGGILEDGSGLDGELAALVNCATLPPTLILEESDFLAATHRTCYAPRPADLSKEVQAYIGGR
jgi:hypothetical protein